MKTPSERAVAMNEMLSSHAVPYGGEERYEREDLEEGEERLNLEIDHGRIVHCEASRMLAGKTQVFMAGEDPSVRTRLTHTLEVAQITRVAAARLGLNVHLAECIALAHDLGHSPFGHKGQDALNEWMQQHGDVFEHNRQSHRVVTKIETPRVFQNGLNLTRHVVDGLLKHDGGLSTLEAQLANTCDMIAYTAHDTDDGLSRGLFTYGDLRHIPFAERMGQEACKRDIFIRSAIITTALNDLIENARTTEAKNGKPTIGLSPRLKTEMKPLKKFLYERMYFHDRIMWRMKPGQEAIRFLCDRLNEKPSDTVRALQDRLESPLHVAVKDHVAGLTDDRTMQEAAQLK